MTWVSLAEVVREHVQPHHSVIVVGPASSIEKDFLPVAVSARVRRARGGRVTLLSPRLHADDVSERLHPQTVRFLRRSKIPLQEYSRLLRPGGGEGGLLNYVRSFKTFRSSLYPEKNRRRLPVPLLHVADALRSRPKEPADVLFDVDAAGHACGLWSQGSLTRDVERRVARYARNAFRMVRPGGTAFFFLGASAEGFLDRLLSHLERAGFNTSACPVRAEPYDLFGARVHVGSPAGFGFALGGPLVASSSNGMLIHAARPATAVRRQAKE